MIKITNKRINTAKLLKELVNENIGAVASFMGIVRNNNDGFPVKKIWYDCHKNLAKKSFAEIKKFCAEKWQIENIIMVHRIGEVNAGEVALFIAVSAEHRTEAFSACRYALEEIKRSAPLWKKEIGSHGERWV